MTKAERRELARAKALELKEAELRHTKRTRIAIISAAAVAIVAIVAAVFFIVRDGNKKADVVAPEGFEKTSTIVIGQGEGNVPTVGVKNEGAPTVDLYSDYLCTHCNDLEKRYGNQLFNLAAEGKITLNLHPVSILGYSFSAAATAADYYVAHEAPGKYALYRATVLSDVTEPVFANKGGEPKVDVLYDVAKKVGLSDDVIAGMKDILSKNTYANYVKSLTEQFSKDGLTGTPTVIVNGTKLDDWSKVIETAANGKTWTTSNEVPKAS